MAPLAQGSYSCYSTSDVNIMAPSFGETLSGKRTLAAETSTSALGVGFALEPKVSPGTILQIGPAQPLAGSNGTKWERPEWDSAMVLDGDYRLHVRADFPNTGPCHGDPIDIKVANATGVKLLQPVLSLKLSPTGWEGSTNVSVPFAAAAAYTDEYGKTRDVTAYTSFAWATSLGSIQSKGASSTYYSGPTGGTGAVFLGGEYKGVRAKVQVPVRVHALAAAPTESSVEPAPAQAPATSTATPTAAPTAAQPHRPVTTALSPATEKCITGRIPAAAFAEMRLGRRSASLEERLVISGCYDARGIVPARFAPVEPEAVRGLPAAPAEVLRVVPAKTVERTDQSGISRRGLKFSGKAEPGKTVFIYVFSEPLVLKAQADSSGNWEYVLHNPLKPGKHEVFVTMERAPKEFMRSEPLLISVAKAAESPDNPQGGGLELAATSRQAEIQYALAALLLVLVSIRLVFRMRARPGAVRGI